MPDAVDVARDKPNGTTRWVPDKHEQLEIDAIDATIERMRKCTPADPYVNTIPQDVEPRYHHPNYTPVALAWRSGTPFQNDDHEFLQYATFKFHEPGETCFTQKPSQKDQGVDGSNAKSSAGSSTPSGGPKKKITLDAYKRKQAGVSTTPEPHAANPNDTPGKQAAVKGPAERVKSEKEDILAAVAEVEGIAVQDFIITPASAPKMSAELKRKREDEAGDVKVQSVARVDTPAADKDVSLSKRARTSGDLKEQNEAKGSHSHTARKMNTGEKRSEQPEGRSQYSHDSTLPPRLSPGMPPRLSPKPMPTKLSPLGRSSKPASTDPDPTPPLPERMSPNLPQNIIRTLKARKVSEAESQLRHQAAAETTSKDKDGKLTVATSLDRTKTSPRGVPRNGFRANSSSPAVRSDVEGRDKHTTAPKSRAKSPDGSKENEIVEAKSSEPKAQRHSRVVKLKYRKSRKEDIQRILKMRPKPAKQLITQSSDESAFDHTGHDNTLGKVSDGQKADKEEVTTKGVAQKVGPVQTRKKLHGGKSLASGKRPPSDDDVSEPPPRRRRSISSDSRKDPSTPSRLDLTPPGEATSNQKSHLQATPSSRKALLAVAMQRDQSQDSFVMQTPPALSTPMLTNSQQPSSQHVNGTSRPSTSQPSIKTPKQQAWELEQARLTTLGRDLKHKAANQQGVAAAVTALESFLCFMLAFTANDEANAAADPRRPPSHKNWDSLRGFYAWVKRTTEPHAPLGGLACALGVVFSARTLGIISQYQKDAQKEFRDIKDLLVLQSIMQSAARDSEAKLDVDALQEAFPQTWAARTKGTLPAAEQLEPVKFDGPYKLPITLSTTPVCAARAGHSMVKEWVSKNKVEHTFRLKL